MYIVYFQIRFLTMQSYFSYKAYGFFRKKTLYSKKSGFKIDNIASLQ